MSLAHEIDAQAADWIAQRDRGPWPDESQRGLDAWIAQSPAHRVAYLRLNVAWERADRLRALRAAEPAKSIEQRPMSHKRKLVRAAGAAMRGQTASAWMSRVVAAVAVIGIALSLSGDPDRRTDLRSFATPVGAREIVALEDGSKLTLNTATRLVARVDPIERTVWLQDGEAYFDIAHDAHRPFVVIVGNRRVTVVGTRFTLRRDGDRLYANVLEGRVQVRADDAVPTLLTRGDSAVGEGRDLLVTRRSERQLIASTSWLEGRLVFDQMTLADAALQFNRYNRKKLVLGDPVAAGIRIGGSFDASNVEGFAHLLQSGFGLAIDSQGDRIVLSSVGR